MKIILLILPLFLACNNNPSSVNDDEETICTEDNAEIECWDGSFVCKLVECPINNYPNWDTDFNGVLDNLNDYQNNGSITSAVFINEVNAGSPGDILAAFVGDEQRGVAIPTEVPFGPYEGTYQFLMMIYTNATITETVTFKFFDNETNEIYDIIETNEFIPDSTLGNVINPVIFTIQ